MPWVIGGCLRKHGRNPFLPSLLNRGQQRRQRNVHTVFLGENEPLSKLLVCPLIAPIVVPYTIPYIIPYITPFKEFRL